MNLTLLREAAIQSPHPTDKIAAQIVYRDGSCDLPCTNARPRVIDDLNVPPATKIADRSLYAHAETIAIMSSVRPVQNATMLLTDPFCPNCAKQIALAGIKRVIIDGDGFAKTYHNKNQDAFQTLSLSIAARYGVRVFVSHQGVLQELRPKKQVIERIATLDECAVIPTVTGILSKTITTQGLRFISNAFTPKYDDRVEAATVAMMRLAARGRKMDPNGVVQLSHWPETPRIFIDLLAAGMTRYAIKESPAPDWAGQLSTIGITIIPR